MGSGGILVSMKDPTAGTGKTAHRDVDRPTAILLVGSTGFVGSRIAASLFGSEGVGLTVLSRKPAEHPLAPHGITVPGDLGDPHSLAEALRGVDVVIHAASYVGKDPRPADEVNRQGTANLLAECRRLGVDRFVYLSTTSVYGSGPHRGITEEDGTYSPQSPISAARAEADRMVLDSGGAVIRPNLIFGTGDKWFIPGLVKMLRTGVWPGDGSALLSLIGVKELGKMAARLALSPENHGRAFHAVGSRPVTAAELITEVSAALRLPAPAFGPEAVGRDALTKAGFTAHQVDLVTRDHWYAGTALRDATGWNSDTAPLPDADEWDWYRTKITEG
ncbi:NAD-dependent epimerase/dehydratase family protein [Arthrobacter woluwensis]|uniref:NAD-dependent epimerase/dehydratase family protein n=1 Tax=Arthrobacter woluwensis TaxID=156980 RepID=UPI0015E7CC99|nr:NAD(P)-dependent oxidoreductase [Arthrobacter woluwensis]